MSASLVGSEMCIRDSSPRLVASSAGVGTAMSCSNWLARGSWRRRRYRSCLLYTSDAADDM
eukprot:936264-Alexandrium_andersonii.AAC.1